MADCFISYSSQDQALANFVHSELSRHGLTVFMASVSLVPGQNWSEAIRENLRSSSWVILLASRAACQSAYVLQESGMAMVTEKQIIPIIWDINPSELPGWIDRNHALNLAGATVEQVQDRISEIAQTIRQNKAKGLLIAGALVFGLILLGNLGNES